MARRPAPKSRADVAECRQLELSYCTQRDEYTTAHMTKQPFIREAGAGGLDGAVERLRRTYEEKSKKKSATPEPPQSIPGPPANVVQLPLWPELTRGAPNTFLRGALFAAIQGKERRALKGELLACQKGQSIRFTGWQLDQSDLDVWEQAAELA